MALLGRRRPRLISVSAYPNAEFSAEFYEIRAGERACFQAIY